VIEGQDVVDRIDRGDAIKSISILRVGKEAEAFKTDQAAFDAAMASIKERENDAHKAQKEKIQKLIKEQWPKATQTKSGLFYQVEQKGEGEPPATGTEISAHYTGRLLVGNRKFDSSYDRGEPIAFPVGTGRVIRGWDEALSQMTKGEKRTLIIPPELAYGERGAGGVIPPNAWLVFDVELVDF
jgi:peptidylprolyl isomerase